MTALEGGPLSGLRVLDLTRGVAGAVAGMLFSDYGADVLRIEPPGGDPLWDEHPGYAVWHRGKQVVEMDLRDPRSRSAIVARLPATDILLESFAPGTLARFGLVPSQLSAVAPGLVTVSISGYGQEGPDRDRPGFDALVQARTGGLARQGGEAGRPVFCTHPWPSFGAALLGVLGGMAALLRRGRTGRGGVVDTSLLDGVLAQSTMYVVDADHPPAEMAGPARLSGVAPTMAIYRCGDGRYLHLHTGARGAFERLCHATGIDPSPFAGPATARHFRGDPAGAERFGNVVASALATRPRDEWVEVLMSADVAVAPCLEIGEALRHPQTAAIGMAIEVADPLHGPTLQVGLPMQFETTPGACRGAAVRRGFTPNPEAALRHSGWPTAEELAASPAVAGSAASASSGRRDRREPRAALAQGEADGASAPPLAGIRVLDFGMFAAGPYAAMLLADLGADVVKVEPLEGDTMRPATRNFLGLHRGKRGLALDLKAPGARAVVERIVPGTDVVIHNLRPGVAERLGIGWERLSAIEPALVYCHNTAYGSRGPMASRAGFDQMYQAFCGMETFQAGERNPPRQVTGAPLDYGNALLSAAAVLMALHARERTGRGQRLECPQLAAGLFAMSDVFESAAGLSRPFRLDRDGTGYGPAYRLYRARGGWLFVCCPDDDARARFAGMAGNGGSSLFEAVSVDDALARLGSADVPCEAVRPFAGDALLADPEMIAAGRVVETDHPTLGRLRQLGGFVRFDGAAPHATRSVPRVGEDTREVLREAGFSDDAIERLRTDRVVDWPADR